MRTLCANGTETVWRMCFSISVPLSFLVLTSAVFEGIICDTNWPCSAVSETPFCDVIRSFSDGGIPAVFLYSRLAYIPNYCYDQQVRRRAVTVKDYLVVLEHLGVGQFPFKAGHNDDQSIGRQYQSSWFQQMDPKLVQIAV